MPWGPSWAGFVGAELNKSSTHLIIETLCTFFTMDGLGQFRRLEPAEICKMDAAHRSGCQERWPHVIAAPSRYLTLTMSFCGRVPGVQGVHLIP